MTGWRWRKQGKQRGAGGREVSAVLVEKNGDDILRHTHSSRIHTQTNPNSRCTLTTQTARAPGQAGTRHTSWRSTTPAPAPPCTCTRWPPRTARRNTPPPASHSRPRWRCKRPRPRGRHSSRWRFCSAAAAGGRSGCGRRPGNSVTPCHHILWETVSTRAVRLGHQARVKPQNTPTLRPHTTARRGGRAATRASQRGSRWR